MVFITHAQVEVHVDVKQALQLKRHMRNCPLCLDEAHGTRGCPRFEGTVESFLLESPARRER